MRRAKVYLVPKACLLEVLRGEKKVRNFPADAELVAADCGVSGLGIRVHSQSFDEVAPGEQLPVVTAVLERRA